MEDQTPYNDQPQESQVPQVPQSPVQQTAFQQPIQQQTFQQHPVQPMQQPNFQQQSSNTYNQYVPGYTPNNNFGSNNYVMNVLLNSLAGWMKFIGICTIISGAITCLGILTAIVGVPCIFQGLALTNASKNIKLYRDTNNPLTLNEFLTDINKYFKIQGIFLIIGLALTVIYIAIIFVVLIAAASAGY